MFTEVDLPALEGAVVVACSRSGSTEVARLLDGRHVAVNPLSRRDTVEIIGEGDLPEWVSPLTVRPSPPYPLGEVKLFAPR